MAVFDPQSFANPSHEFRPLQIVHGLDRFLTDSQHLQGEEGIDHALQRLERLGAGGIVTNVGFSDYLTSPRQWEVLRYGLGKAAAQGLELWIYDEKGYPSGSAGGIVTRANPEYAALGLACYTRQVTGPAEVRFDLPVSCRKFIWCGAAPGLDQVLASDVIDLTGAVDDWQTLRWQAPAGEWTLIGMAERVMYEGTHASNNVSDFKHYPNLLNPAAVRAFLRVTHEQYAREIPPDLWGRVRAFFTDEPSLMVSLIHRLPEMYYGKVPVVDAPLFTDFPPAAPWVEDLLAQFKAHKGYDLAPHLFQLFFTDTEEAAYARQDYYEVATRLYVDAFYRQVLDWCQAHGVASSGHVLVEEDLFHNVAYHGDLLATVRQMDLPGIDMLNADPQSMLEGLSFMTVKQVSSAAHLTGRKRVHSESSDWEQQNVQRTATLAERQGQGNLQYVLGINQITSYYGWDKLGEAAQAEYHAYMGRLASLLTGGSHVCDVALLYPVRSMWAHFLPYMEPPVVGSNRKLWRSPWMSRLQDDYPNLVRLLLRSQVDLDIIDEQGIGEARLEDGALCLEDERYRAVVLPAVDALSLATAQALADFARGGGVVVCAGTLPTLAESAAHTPMLREMAAKLVRQGLWQALPPEQAAAYLRARGLADLALDQPNPDILYTHRRLEDHEVYFIINNAPTPAEISPSLRAPGPYRLYWPGTGVVEAATLPLRLPLAGYGAVFVTTASS